MPTEEVRHDDLHRGISINPEREDLFRDQFLISLRVIGVQPSQFGPGRLHDVIKWTFEAIQNVYDHADRKPLARGSTAITSGFSVSSAGDSIRVRVSDDGVGIAARQCQSTSVYEGDVEEEMRLVGEALASRGSAKIAAQDCRVRGVVGYGFTYITSCLASLGADATLTTGRLRFRFDRAAGGFARDPRYTGFTPGTTLDAVIRIGYHQTEERP